MATQKLEPLTKLNDHHDEFVRLYIQNHCLHVDKAYYIVYADAKSNPINRGVARVLGEQLLGDPLIIARIKKYRDLIRQGFMYDQHDHFNELCELQDDIKGKINKNGYNYNAWLKAQELKGKTLGLYSEKIVNTNYNNNTNDKIEIHFIDNAKDAI